MNHTRKKQYHSRRWRERGSFLESTLLTPTAEALPEKEPSTTNLERELKAYRIIILLLVLLVWILGVSL